MEKIHPIKLALNVIGVAAGTFLVMAVVGLASSMFDAWITREALKEPGEPKEGYLDFCYGFIKGRFRKPEEGSIVNTIMKTLSSWWDSVGRFKQPEPVMAKTRRPYASRNVRRKAV